MNPVLQAIAQSCVEATAASHGWILAISGDNLTVVAAAGDQPGEFLQMSLPSDSGAAGFVVSSGNPLAVTPRVDDQRLADSLTSRLGEPLTSVLCVPCGGEDAVLGALELVNKQGGAPFSIDDIELATLLANIAGAVLETAVPESTVRPPSELAAELHQLSASDPMAYARVATLLDALLARG